MPSVFISHSSLDRDAVEQNIIAPLREHGIGTWYSKDSIETADEWEKKIKDGLKSCDWFLVVMTPHSAGSKWVQREVFWAIDKREGHIIPVMLETCDPEELNLALLPMQYIDFRQNIELGQKRLLANWGLDEAMQVSSLYISAEKAIADQAWAVAIDKLQALLNLDPTQTKAQDQMSYARQQKELAELYDKGVTHFKAGRWQEALVDLGRVRTIDRTYRDVTNFIADAYAQSSMSPVPQQSKAESPPSLRLQDSILQLHKAPSPATPTSWFSPRGRRRFYIALLSVMTLLAALGSPFGFLFFTTLVAIVGGIILKTRYGHRPLQRVYLAQYIKAFTKSFLPLKKPSKYNLLVCVVYDPATGEEQLLGCTDDQVTPVRDANGSFKVNSKLRPAFTLHQGISRNSCEWNEVWQTDKEMYRWFKGKIYERRSLPWQYGICFLPFPLMLAVIVIWAAVWVNH